MENEKIKGGTQQNDLISLLTENKGTVRLFHKPKKFGGGYM
jgi:hypothetical protein